MTNREIAHKRGLDKAPAPATAYKDALLRSGLKLVAEEKTVLGMSCYEAEIETQCGTLHILCGNNGTARIDKPNGTHKWVYEKTPNQIACLLKQVQEFYK